MKILKYILYAIIGLSIIFFAIGLMKPSVSYGHEITVNKSLKEAWAVSQDQSKLGQWLDGFKSIELISGEKGKVGSKYKVIVSPGDGQPDFEMIETVISVKEFDHVKLKFDSDFMDFEQVISFQEKDGMTAVKTDSEVVGNNLMSRSMFAIMEMTIGAFSGQEELNIEELKKVIQDNTTDYFPTPNVIDDEIILPEEDSKN